MNMEMDDDHLASCLGMKPQHLPCDTNDQWLSPELMIGGLELILNIWYFVRIILQFVIFVLVVIA